MKWIINMFQGFSMAVADSVPGVSGGTIALILGFYDQFIHSLDDLIRGSMTQRIQALKFLVKLMAGWVIGFAISVNLLGYAFEHYMYQMCSLFFGLTFFAIPIIIRDERQSIKGHYGNIIFTFVGLGLVSLITFMNTNTASGTGVDLLSMTLWKYLYIFIAAMIAISAMVLPGISGSTLLLIFGLYVPIIRGIKELLHLNLSYFPVVLVFGLGIVAGGLSIVRIIKVSLERHRPQVIYLVIGMMIGSMYAITMGPTTFETWQPGMSISTFHPLSALLGGLILLGLQKLKNLWLKQENTMVLIDL